MGSSLLVFAHLTQADIFCPYDFLLVETVLQGNMVGCNWFRALENIQGVHLKLRFIICLLERVIFSYMGHNMQQNFRMCWTFWYINAQEKYYPQRNNCYHISSLSQIQKNKENTLKNLLKIGQNCLFVLIFVLFHSVVSFFTCLSMGC